MSAEVWLLAALAFVASLALTWGVLRVAHKHGLIDQPNARSSHSVPTPRGGGLAIVVVSAAGTLGLLLLGVIELRLGLALLAGGLPVAVVGFVDDRRSVPARLRLSVHLGAAVAGVALLGGMPPLQVGALLLDPGLVGDLLAVVAVAWVLNLFNFMDGIDGIAASQAIFVAACGAMIAYASGGSMQIPAACAVFAASCLGFLLWNWPPAKIFMGDVGSGFLGYVIAILALGASRDSPVAMWAWLIGGGVFFVDATTTLLRRLLRGEQVYMAHRSHAYQRLSRRWNSHRRVTIAVWIVNLSWLLPCSVLAAKYPHLAAWIVLAAFAPVILAAIIAGAGEHDPPVA